MDDKKLKELILYVAKKSEADPAFGSVKLNKILFYSDFLAYAYTGESISGQPYQKLERGPGPRHFLPIRGQLEKEGACAIQEIARCGLPQKRLIALRDPDLSIFNGEEIAIVDDILDQFADKSGTECSRISHSFIGWEVARLGEDIPYETVFVSQRELSESEKAHGLTLEPPDARAAR